MNILHVGWWTREFRDGGIIIAAESLMKGQKKIGHNVRYFCGGRYNLLKNKPYIKSYARNDIKVYELVNSPNLIWDFGSIRYHIHNPDAEFYFEKIVKEFQPEVVHIQELESLSAGIIDICKKHSIPTVMTLRNYWPLCPQRDLIDFNDRVCMDYQDGFKCRECNVLPLTSRFRWMLLAYLGIKKVPQSLTDMYSFYENFMSRYEETPQLRYFIQRRKQFVERLNSIKLIALSTRVKEIYEMFGVCSDNITVINSSSDAIGFIRREERKEPVDVIRFGYMGGIQRNKGVHIILDAFHEISGSEKCVLNIHGDYRSEYGLSLVKKSRDPRVSFYGDYRYENLNNVLETIDVGIIPSVWEETGPQVAFEMLHAGIPVIGSNIGGIPDFVVDGVNGFLFEPGNSSDLADKMRRFIENPKLVSEFSANTKPHKTLEEYTSEIMDFYKSL